MIEIKKLDKWFNGNHVLNELDLDIREGEILAIVGRSGSGKSVLLKHIMGILKPNSGEVLVGDVDMTKLEGKKLYEQLKPFSMIFQGGALFDSLTVGENVGFYIQEHGMRGGEKFDKSGLRPIVEEALASVGLGGKADLYPADLSGGMKKRAAIARSVCYQPKFLLYDEPTTGLDPVTAMTIGNLIVEQHNKLKGTTTIVVSHDIYTTVNIADRIALIEDGKIQEVNTPEEFMKKDHPTIHMFNKVIGGDIKKVREKQE